LTESGFRSPTDAAELRWAEDRRSGSERRPAMLVKDVMTVPAVTVQTDTALKEVALLLTEKRISGLPVVDVAGRLVGVISEADILLIEQGAPTPATGLLALRRRRGRSRSEAKTAGEAMTSPALTIEPSRSLTEAARVMIEAGVNRLPVVVEGTLVGIVTRADLVRAFVRPDVEIEGEIRDDVALRSHGVDPNALSVVVRAGQVELGGRVATPEDAALVERLVRGIPGVVGVDSRLTWGAEGVSRG
jgi:CBS domain-containing protein